MDRIANAAFLAACVLGFAGVVLTGTGYQAGWIAFVIGAPLVVFKGVVALANPTVAPKWAARRSMGGRNDFAALNRVLGAGWIVIGAGWFVAGLGQGTI